MVQRASLSQLDFEKPTLSGQNLLVNHSTVLYSRAGTLLFSFCCCFIFFLVQHAPSDFANSEAIFQEVLFIAIAVLDCLLLQ